MKEKTERSLATPFKGSEESIPGTPYCRVYGHSLWLNAYNNLVTIGIGGGKAWPSGFDRNTMQGALSGDPSADQYRSERIYNVSLVSPIHCGIFSLASRGQAAKPEKLSFLVSSIHRRCNVLPPPLFLPARSILESVWTNVGENMEMSRDIFTKKKSLGARGELPQLESGRPNFLLFLNRERIPLDLPGGEILDGGLHDPRGRKESFVESPSLPRNPSHRSKFRIN